MDVLHKLSKYRLQLNRSIREHILRAAQSLHCVVVYVQAKAVEAKEHTNPVQVRDDRIPVTKHSIQQVVLVYYWIVIPHQKDTSVSACTQDEETANPHMVGKDRKRSGIVSPQVRIRRHRVHMVCYEDAKRTHHS